MDLLNVFLSGIVGALVGAFVGGRLQSAAIDRQIAADQVGRELASAEAAEASRLDRLERGVADMRAAALALVFEAQTLGGMPTLLRTRSIAITSVDRVAGHLAPMAAASTAVKVNGDREMAALADELHQETMVVMRWLNGRSTAWRKEDVPAGGVGNAAIDLERAMRALRGYEALPVPGEDEPAALPAEVS